MRAKISPNNRHLLLWIIPYCIATTIRLIVLKSKAMHSILSVIIVALLCLSLSNNLQAAQVYKWVDEKGVTHFSSRPPPKPQKNNLKVENLKAKNSLARGRGLSGDWWGIKNSRTTRRIKFGSRRDFKVTEFTFLNGGLREKQISKGRYKIEGNSLRLIYDERITRSGDVRQSDVYIFSLENGTRLLLENSFESVAYAKESHSKAKAAGDLKGIWKDQKGIHYQFTGNVVKKYTRNYRKMMFIGEFSWHGDVLAVNVLADFSQPVDHRKGRVDRWKVTSKSYQEIHFVEEANQKPSLLTRKR